MTYAVKEIYYTLQGEGAQAGRPAVFCRFAGCNLWSGRESDRAKAVCKFCDTDFVGTDGTNGGEYTDAKMVARAVAAAWPKSDRHGAQKFVVCTGGEPLLHLDASLVRALHDLDFTVAIETNGTRPVPAGIDWVCMSPKAGTSPVVHSGDELKFVFPQTGLNPEHFENFDFKHFFLQPMDGPHVRANVDRAVQYCLNHPRWRLSVQQHKLLGLR